jgi:hypothetical protein
MPYPPDQHGYPAPPIIDQTSPHMAGSVASPTSQSSIARQPYGYTGAASSDNGRGAWPSQHSPFDSDARNNPNINPDLAAYTASSDERLGVHFLLDSNQRIARIGNGLSPDQENSSRDSQSGSHSTSLRLTEPTCPLDNLLLDFLASRQRLAAQGADSETLVGPLYPNFNALVNRGTAYPSHPLSLVFTDILRTFPDLRKLPDQVATVHLMFLTMRWCCEPTKENWNRMPEWMRPVPLQHFTEHPFWLDFLPWYVHLSIYGSQPSLSLNTNEAVKSQSIY